MVDSELFQVWMPGFHDMGDVNRTAELMGEAKAETFEQACVIVMQKQYPKPDPGYWTPEKPTIHWNFQLCRTRAEADAHTPEDLRGKNQDQMAGGGRGRYG